MYSKNFMTKKGNLIFCLRVSQNAKLVAHRLLREN